MLFEEIQLEFKSWALLKGFTHIFALFCQWHLWNLDAESCTRYKLTYNVVFPFCSICETHISHLAVNLTLQTGKYEMTFLVQQSFSQHTPLVGKRGINFWQGTKNKYL